MLERATMATMARSHRRWHGLLRAVVVALGGMLTACAGTARTTRLPLETVPIEITSSRTAWTAPMPTKLRRHVGIGPIAGGVGDEWDAPPAPPPPPPLAKHRSFRFAQADTQLPPLRKHTGFKPRAYLRGFSRRSPRGFR